MRNFARRKLCAKYDVEMCARKLPRGQRRNTPPLDPVAALVSRWPLALIGADAEKDEKARKLVRSDRVSMVFRYFSQWYENDSGFQRARQLPNLSGR